MRKCLRDSRPWKVLGRPQRKSCFHCSGKHCGREEGLWPGGPPDRCDQGQTLHRHRLSVTLHSSEPEGPGSYSGGHSPPFCSVFPKTILILTTYGLLEAEVRTTPFGIRSPGLVAHHLILLSLCVFHLEKGVKVGNQSSSWGYCESLMRSFSKGLAHHLAYKTVQYN